MRYLLPPRRARAFRAFARGSRMLLFLQRNSDGWAPAEGLFSRWARDVLIGDAPWLAAVEG